MSPPNRPPADPPLADAPLEYALHGLFPTPFMRMRAPGAAALNQSIKGEIAAIRATTPNGAPADASSRAYTTLETDDQLHRRAGLTDLVAIVAREFHAFAEAMDVDFRDDALCINGCWLTVLREGAATDIRRNPNSLFTAIYFVAAPADGAALLLHGPIKETSLMIPVVEENRLNRQLEPCQPEPGDLAVFPSSLLYNFHVHGAAADHISLTFTATLGSLGVT